MNCHPQHSRYRKILLTLPLAIVCSPLLQPSSLKAEPPPDIMTQIEYVNKNPSIPPDSFSANHKNCGELKNLSHIVGIS